MARHPGAITLPRNRPPGPACRAPVYVGGLGFGFKWNMGWMHDTLAYMRREPVHRKCHHDELTFGLLYAFAENFVLPLSPRRGRARQGHAHLADAGRRLAEIRDAARLLRPHVGLSGQEAPLHGPGIRAGPRVGLRWRALDWRQLDIGWHRGVQALVRDLQSHLPRERALHERDCEPDGFRWIEVADARELGVRVAPLRRRRRRRRSRRSRTSRPCPARATGSDCRAPGRWREILNTDAAAYGGSNRGNAGVVQAAAVAWHDQSASATITLPPLATLWLVHDGEG